jgi:hypothetical protein
MNEEQKQISTIKAKMNMDRIIFMIVLVSLVSKEIVPHLTAFAIIFYFMVSALIEICTREKQTR